MTVSENFLLGDECKLYYATADLDGDSVTPATASWNEITNIKDVTVGASTDEDDITTRANNGFRATAATIKNCQIDFVMLWLPGNTAFDAIQTAWSARGEIGIAAMDGAIATAGSQGIASNMVVTNMTRNEPVAGAVTANVTLKPSSQSEWYEAAGS